ncbi:MAG TPA: PEGA domain-containing protein [Polyangiaceae bacterium]
MKNCRSLSRSRLLLGGWLALSTVTTPAFADDTQEKKELSQARAQFQQGIELEQAGNWANALQLFRQVGQVRMTPQVQYHIARCEEELGRLVTALGGYKLALEEAETVGANFKSEVEGRLDQLQARIPKLVIQRGSGAEAATIELDGVPLGASRIGIENEVDPGPHQVTAKSPGYKTFAQTVTVAEEGKQTLKVALEKLPEDAASGGGGGGGGPMDQGGRERPNYMVPILLGSAGGALLITGGVLFALRANKLSSLDKLCPGQNCNPLNVPGREADKQRALDLRDSAETMQLLGWVTLGVGVAAIGTGAVFFYLESKKGKGKEASKTASLHRLELAGSAPGADAGLSLIGHF